MNRIKVLHLLKHADNLTLLVLIDVASLHSVDALYGPLAALDPATYVFELASDLIVVMLAKVRLVSGKVAQKSKLVHLGLGNALLIQTDLFVLLNYSCLNVPCLFLDFLAVSIYLQDIVLYLVNHLIGWLISVYLTFDLLRDLHLFLICSLCNFPRNNVALRLFQVLFGAAVRYEGFSARRRC